MHYGPFERQPKIFNSINYQFWPNFKVQLTPLWLELLKNELHFRKGDKMATNLTLMQQFLTLLNPILAHSALYPFLQKLQN